MVFLITGCAHCGNTVLSRLFYAFDNMYVYWDEASPGKQEKIWHKRKDNTEHTAIKRMGHTLFSGGARKPEWKENAVRVVKETDMEVIVSIRDGRDAIYSTACKKQGKLCGRWCVAMQELEEYREYVGHIVRYEDVVTNPDLEQQKLMDKYGLTAKYKFSEYPVFVPPEPFEFYTKRNMMQYRPRPLDTNSIGQGREAYRDICKNWKKIDHWLERFGYE